MEKHWLLPVLLAVTFGCGEGQATGGDAPGQSGMGGGASAGNATGGTSGGKAGGGAGGGSTQAGSANQPPAGGGGSGTAGSGGAPEPMIPNETVVHEIPSLPDCTTPYPHDPAVDEATGLVYYADSNESCIGELNPETMEYRAWPTPTPGSYPHGLVVDDQSRVFYTAQNTDRIGRLVPATETIEDFAVDATGPHTPTFHDGNIWFTAQQGGQFGTFDREAGTAVVYPFDDTASRPYGMWPAPDGSLWVALFGVNRLARIDVSTNPPGVEEFTLPNEDSRPRRIAVDGAGRVWYTDYPRRMLGLLDPAAPEADRFAEFPMPGGGQPYGIAIGPDGRVWVDDEDVPEIVGFDPESRSVIAQLPVPIDNAGPVRNMVVDHARKRIWLAISDVGYLGVLQF